MLFYYRACNPLLSNKCKHSHNSLSNPCLLTLELSHNSAKTVNERLLTTKPSCEYIRVVVDTYITE